MDSGCFIVFEGPDGSGKSSLIKLFSEYLNQKNLAYLITREPGGNQVQLSEQIRNLVLNQENLNISYVAEAYLFAASRAQHVRELIIPHLKQNQIVVSDRFILSSLAYQGYVRNIGIENVYNLNKLALNDIKIDLTFYIDVDYKIGLQRIKDNQREQNRLDKEEDMHKKVIDGYHLAMKAYPQFNYHIIDGNQSLIDCLNDIIKIFESYYFKKENKIC